MIAADERRRAIAARSFAPVEFFHREPSVDGGVVHGFAAPSAGKRPCQILLRSGSELLAVASCDGYSAHAAREQVRLGWCAFALGGLHAAVALDQPAELLCAVSDRRLAAWSREDFENIRLNLPRPPLAVTGLRRFTRGLHGCADVRQIIPFLEHFLERRGPRELISALWRYFLRREMTEIEVDRIAADLPSEWKLEWLLHLVTNSDEFKAGLGYPLPGPFEADFPFGLDLLSAGAPAFPSRAATARNVTPLGAELGHHH